jgi:hypothetical protein
MVMMLPMTLTTMMTKMTVTLRKLGTTRKRTRTLRKLETTRKRVMTLRKPGTTRKKSGRTYLTVISKWLQATLILTKTMLATPLKRMPMMV